MEKVKRLYRSRTDKTVCGVIGGLVHYFGWNIDPVVVRLIFVFAFLVTGLLPLLITYIVAAIIIPLEPEAPPPSRPE